MAGVLNRVTTVLKRTVKRTKKTGATRSKEEIRDVSRGRQLYCIRFIIEGATGLQPEGEGPSTEKCVVDVFEFGGRFYVCFVLAWSRPFWGGSWVRTKRMSNGCAAKERKQRTGDRRRHRRGRFKSKAIFVLTVSGTRPTGCEPVIRDVHSKSDRQWKRKDQVNRRICRSPKINRCGG